MNKFLISKIKQRIFNRMKKFLKKIKTNDYRLSKNE